LSVEERFSVLHLTRHFAFVQHHFAQRVRPQPEELATVSFSLDAPSRPLVRLLRILGFDSRDHSWLTVFVVACDEKNGIELFFDF
jgi:hypothetical protein